MKIRFLWFGALCLCIELASAPLWSQNGAALFKTYCASCHDAPDSRAPSRAVLKQMSPQQIITALEKGAMKAQGAERSRAQRRALAEFLTGKQLQAVNPIPQSAFCQGPAIPFRPDAASWNGWGVTMANARFQPADAAGLSPGDVPKLKLKWAFGFPGASSASAQPVVFGGRVYVGSWEGDVYSLDAKTGCIHWTLEAEAGVRSAISIVKTGAGYTAYFGDLAANVYAVNAVTGKMLWKVKVDDYPLARVTGSPTFYDGRLYVPVAAREESQVANPKYPCCRFRGNVVALDAATGKRIWKTYAIGQKPHPTTKSRAGTQLWGPSGAGIWNSPTIDPKRNVLYVGTGNSYSFPPVKTTDSVMALDLDSGKIRWVRQMTPLDVWNGGCRHGDPAICSKDAPDYDFGASPILVTLTGGRQMLLAANKSAIVYALDPDRNGRIIWQTKIGRGGTSGGVLWGAATDGRNLYAPLTDAVRIGKGRAVDPNVGGGLVAVDFSGRTLWSTPNPPCDERKPCSPTQAAAAAAIPGVVFSGSNDGHLRAYATASGKVIWEYDTVREFKTVNGVPARGGSINNGGPAVAGGMLFTNSGYSHHSGVIPGNVLLAFSAQ